ncbi:MAG: UDP-N-acetylmuramate dehydrogenase, partial [Methyloceanibacter sp.]
MNGRDLESRLVASLPKLRGRLKAETPLKDLTWFRAGGPAEVLYSPADEADLAYFLSEVPAAIPVTVIGLGSNLLVRDGGIEGVVIRLGRGFGEVAAEDGFKVRAGAAVPDVKVARAAAEAGIAGLSFYRGIPGCVGGALRMNGGAHGRETKEVLVEARAIDRKGNIQVLPVAALDYAYRHCGAPDDVIFTEALFQGAPGEPAKILAEMDDIAAYREEVQPIKSRTGGSTFKNPPGHKAWQLIDRAGCRGLNVGDAKVSEM